MFDFSNPETVWLNITNLGLGLVTLAAVLGVSVVLIREIAGRLRASVPSMEHTLHHPELGLTMADGGEPIEPKTVRPSMPAPQAQKKASA